MNVAVCFNRVPSTLSKGEAGDRISEEGAEAEAKAVCKALRELGHTAALIAAGSDVAKLIDELRKTDPQVVFNLCEGFWGDSGKEMHVAALFDLLGYACTGAAALCLGLTQDKALTKDLLMRHSLPTPWYILVKTGEHCPKTHDLPYPLIVKPRFEDASLGITGDSIVTNEPDLIKRVAYVHATYRQGALVEEFIEGREINASVLGAAPFEVMPLSEIRFDPGMKHAVVSYDGKWLEDSEEYAHTEPLCPAPLVPREEQLIRDVSLRACEILETRDYARVDIRLRDGIPYILEVNANPDISPGAGLARSAQAGGLSYPKLIERILAMALKRKEAADAKP